MAGGDFTDTLTFWVTLSTIPLWAIAIVLKRINARLRALQADHDPRAEELAAQLVKWAMERANG